jgi:O-succinylbenzoic acid--CoA ligase
VLDACARTGVRALASYGLTEACSQVTTQRLVDPPSSRGAGPPLAGTRVRVDAGRILVRGPTLMSGYFRAPPAASGIDAEGWLDTGDFGEVDERGHLHVHARRADLIVTGGENVYPAEIEAALEACGGVERAFVFGVPDDRWGAVVAAALVPTRADADPGLLLEGLAGRLASFKRPRRVCLARALPLLGNGKLDRARARREFSPRVLPVGGSPR